MDDIVIIYEKIAIKGTDLYLLKPINANIGKVEKNSKVFIDEEDEAYYSYNDISHFSAADQFYGRPIELSKLAVNNGEEVDDFILMDRYYQKYIDDLLIATLRDNRLTVRKIDNTLLPNAVNQSNSKNTHIAVLYEKQEVSGTINPTYMLLPTGTIYGCLENNKFISDDEEYSSYFDKQAIENQISIYVGHISKVSDIIDSYSEDDLVKLSNKYFAFYQSTILYAIAKEPLTICYSNINKVTFQFDERDFSEADNIIMSELNKILSISSKATVDSEKEYIYEEYRKLNKFLFDDGKIENIGLNDINIKVIDEIVKTINEIKKVVSEINTKNSVELQKKERKKEDSNNYDPNKTKYPDYSFDDLYKGITNVVIGQDEHISKICAVLYKRLVELKLDGKRPSQFGMLISGKTGVGKSEIFKTFANIVDLPIQFMDATQITAAGYVGRDVESYLEELASACNGDISKISQAIMILDEVDKVRGNGGEGGKDVNGKAVQDLFLKFMDGTDYEISDGMFSSLTINTSLMTPISIGAFTDVYNKKAKNNYGFNEKLKNEVKIGMEDFVNFGMSDEFMGRHYINIHLNDMDVPLLLRILKESAKSPLLIQKAIFNNLGVDVKFTHEFQKAVAEEAMKMKSGARSLGGVVANLTWLPISEIDRNRGKYNKLVFTKATVSDPKKYILRRD